MNDHQQAEDEVKRHQDELRQRQLIEDWKSIQVEYPGFVDAMVGFIELQEQSGYQHLYASKDEFDQLVARSMIVASKTLQGVFNRLDSVEQEMIAANEAAATEAYN